MVASSINPLQVLDSYRKSDAVLIVCQNNTKKIIEIAAINEEAARITGYSSEELMGAKLDCILPERISSTIAEFVEFADDRADLLAVLNKIRNFSIKTRDGRKLEFKLRIIRGEAIDRNPWFHLVLVDEDAVRKNNAFRLLLKENFKGHEVIDETTGLPSRLSLIKDLELVVHFVRNNDISGAFAIIDINHFERLHTSLGQGMRYKLHQHIAEVCKQKLRSEDTVGSLSDRMLGIILVDASQESARMVLNRLRWVIGVTPLPGIPKEDVLVPVTIGFTPIDGKINETAILEKCEEFVKGLRENGASSVQLVVTHERREKTERRKQIVPVEKDRRKKERRKGE